MTITVTDDDEHDLTSNDERPLRPGDLVVFSAGWVMGRDVDRLRAMGVVSRVGFGYTTLVGLFIGMSDDSQLRHMSDWAVVSSHGVSLCVSVRKLEAL